MGRLLLSEAEKACSGIGTISIDHNFAGRNPEISTPEILILNLHSGDISFEFPHSFTQLTAHVRKDLEPYIQLERDTGAREIAEAILEQAENCLLITVKPPRAIVDLNRVTEFGIPTLLNKKYSDEARVLQELMDIHISTNRLLMRLLRQITPDFMIDIHTMASHSPLIVPKPARITDGDSLQQHVEAWNRKGEERPVQIFTTFEKDKTVQTIHSQSDLFAVFLFDELCKHDLIASTKKPYSLIEKVHLSQRYLRGHLAAVSIDVPKSEVSDRNGSFRVEKLTVNKERARNIADSIVRATEVTRYFIANNPLATMHL